MYRTHGLRHHPLYDIWRSMIRRCTNPKHRSYPNYGGRGITVCENWLPQNGGVRAFVKDIEGHLGPRPEGMSLDRIDNNGPYETWNLQWATDQMQQSNRRKVRDLQAENERLKARLRELGVTC